MRRDLTRDLQVLDRVQAPDLLEDSQRRARGPNRDYEHDLGPSRRWLRAVPLGIAALAIAIGGFVWLNSAFRATAPRPPAQPTGPNYVFSNVKLDASHPDEEGNILIRFEVSWSGDSFPGIHRCTFQTLGSDGGIVSEWVRRMAFRPSDNVGVDVPPPPGEATAHVGCDPQRLDTPGIAELIPLDPAEAGSDPDVWIETLEHRVDEWAERFDIGSMSPEQLAVNMEALGSLSVTGHFGDEQKWAWTEWGMRRQRLCVLLPEGHELRNKGCLGAGPAP